MQTQVVHRPRARFRGVYSYIREAKEGLLLSSYPHSNTRLVVKNIHDCLLRSRAKIPMENFYHFLSNWIQKDGLLIGNVKDRVSCVLVDWDLYFIGCCGTCWIRWSFTSQLPSTTQWLAQLLSRFNSSQNDKCTFAPSSSRLSRSHNQVHSLSEFPLSSATSSTWLSYYFTASMLMLAALSISNCLVVDMIHLLQ